jgi:uncharacterized protein (DUF885 family)
MKTPLTLIALMLVPGWLFAAAETPDAALDKFFHEYLEAEFELSPLWATSLGDHRFDHLLDDYSPAARARGVAHSRETLERLPQRVDFGKLSPAGKVDFQILRDNLQLGLWLDETEKPFERDPRTYTADATESVYVLFAQSTQPKEVSITAALARMALIPQMLATGRSNLRNPPRVVTETAIKQNLGAISFYEGGLLDLIGETPRAAEVKAAALKVADALREHQSFLKNELLPRSDGAWRLGKERFAHKLELVLNTGASADETLAAAEAQFAQTHRDLLLVARQLWSRFFPREALPPDDAEGRRATIERVFVEIGRDHPAPEMLASEARATVEKIKAFITERDLLRLPELDRCNIIEMPEFQRGNAAAFLSPAPTLDAQAQSIYAISPPPKDWDAERVARMLADNNRQQLQVLTIHEAYPGHYVQLAYASNHASLIRRVFGSGVLAEGWAVYCEQMMLDQGYGGGDLTLRFMQLRFLLLAEGNAVLDYQMHCTPMTDEEGIRFVHEEMLQSEGSARLKVIRAKQSSVQLSSYFAGRTALMQVRQQLQREMGDAFDLGRFHEALLEQGSVPVKYLADLVRARLQKPRL